MSIEVIEATKLYGQQKALDAVSFNIRAGEIVGFLGPNGAGKSTMMKILTGVIPMTSGRAYVDGTSVVDESLAIRGRVGYLPESNPLYDDMYVREYLAFLAGVHKLGKSGKARAAEILRVVGLEPEMHKRIGQLSKGYRQRVGLAQALLHDPRVLILDEPTTGLDPNQIVEIRGLISETGRDKTVMLSTHIMQEVEAICDRIIIINRGRIAAQGTTAEIVARLADNRQRLSVEFDRPVDAAELRAATGAEKVTPADGNTLLAQARPGADLRTKIMEFATQRQLVILQLNARQRTLEEAFQELTLDTPAQA